MKKILLLPIVFLSMEFAQAQNTFKLDSTELTSRIIKDSLDIPWEIIWGPDDHIWMTERFGRISRVDPISGTQQVLLDMSTEVYERSEAGMLGMVLHPDFSTNPHVFVAYTYVDGSNIRERLVRFNYSGNSLVPADTLIENIVGNNTHNGSRLIILPDNTLLMTTGDAQNQNLPQNKTSVVGKVLRMNLDGSIPTDNPDPRSLVWSYGHRNAQGLWSAPNGIIYSSEHGPTTDDELNILSADRNYGWPTVAGFCDSPPEIAFCSSNNVYEPLAAWTPTIAPSDIIWYDHPSIPELKDKLLMTVLKDKSLIAFEFNAAGDSVVNQTKYLKNDLDRLRDICISPDGRIYLATNGSSWANSRPFTHSIVELSNDSYYKLDSTTSLHEVNNTLQIKVGPNPIANGQPLFVNIPEGEQGELVIVDLIGKSILTKELSENNFVELEAEIGVYFWKVQLNGGGSKEGKLIIR
jgi:glucose/arabinose dehydrogenase